MAFVNRSKRVFKPELITSTNIGPGEYLNNESKEQTRALHKISNIFTHRTKLTPLEIKIPFNSTDERKSIFFKTNMNPGPGAYLDISQENKMKNKYPIFTLKDEIVFVKENDDLVPKIKSEKKGFLSSEKRFYEKIDIKDTNYNNLSTEYENYKNNRKYILSYNNKKMHNNRYKKNIFNTKEKSIINKSSLYNTNISIPTIIDKNRDELKYVNEYTQIIKNNNNSSSKNVEDGLGPGQYDIFPKWNSKVIKWKYGDHKESKITLFKNKLISDLKEHNKRDKVNLSVKLNNKKLLKSISNSEILNIDDSQNLNQKNNNSMRNQVFNRHIKDRKKILTEQMDKQKKYNDLVNDIQIKETPGPGFYNNKIHPIIFNTNKTQNFGSNTPKFLKIGNKDCRLGPGSYFLEKNKFQPKIEATVHIKNPEKLNIENNDEGGLYVKNYRMKNKYRYPDVGQYNLSKNFIKDEISNVNSFGILSKRFKYEDFNPYKDDNYNEYIDEKNHRYLYLKTNYQYDDKIQYKINQKFLKIKEEEEMMKKKRRDKFMNKKSPAVGDYSPEFSNSISYNVLSKINKYRNSIAPFNIMNSRFPKNSKLSPKNDIPGPGNYEVANAFDALNNGIKNCYNNNYPNNNSILMENNIISNKNNEEKSTPGPGLYDQNINNSWNKKSFNVLFMEQ